MAGADLTTHPVVGLADIIRLVNRLPHLAGESVLPSPAHFFIPHLHGLPAGSTVDQPVEQIIKGAGVAFHNGGPAVNDFLHLLPFLRRHNRFVAALNHFPVLTGDNVIGVGADAFLMCPADKMCTFIKGISQDMADSRPAPGIIVGVAFCVCLHMGNRDLFFHQPFGNPHAAQPVQGIVVNLADDGRCLRVKDKMPFVLRVTHQTERCRTAAVFPLSGTGHASRQHLFGNIPAVHIVQDILKGRDVHFLTGQAVHAVRDGDIANIVFWEKDFDIASSFDIVPTKSG